MGQAKELDDDLKAMIRASALSAIQISGTFHKSARALDGIEMKDLAFAAYMISESMDCFAAAALQRLEEEEEEEEDDE